MNLRDIASELVLVELPCGDCDSTGRQTGIKVNVISFFNPYEYIEQPCATCFGRGVREADVCPLCLQEESICERACKRTTCCNRHPMVCQCADGIERYQRDYGLPKAA